MKKMIFSAAAFAVAAVSAIAVAPQSAEAVPAFARQTGAACLSCHFQAIPRLAAFGRNFRMNAFRDTGEQALIEDEHLSLPAVFNASFLMKARVSTGKTTNAAGTVTAVGGLIGVAGATGDATQVQFPDETAILFGGRLGEHAGHFVEMGFAPLAGMSMLGYKVAWMFDTDAGAVGVNFGTSDALGLSSVFNDPSNAISRNTRGLQTRARSMRYTLHHSAATGLGVSGYLNNMVYFAAGLAWGAGGGDVVGAGVDFTPGVYARAAVTADVAGLDLVAGGWYTSVGTPNYKQLGLINKGKHTDMGIDLQLQGDLGGASVGFYMPVVISAKNDANFVGAGVAGVADGKVMGFQPVVMVAFGPAGVRLGYDYAKQTVANVVGDTKWDQLIVGAWYDLAQNFTLDLEYDAQKQKTSAGGTVSKLNATTLQLEYVY